MPNYVMVPRTSDNEPDFPSPSQHTTPHPDPAVPAGSGAGGYQPVPTGTNPEELSSKYFNRVQQQDPPNSRDMPQHDPPPPYAPNDAHLPPQHQRSYQSSYYTPQLPAEIAPCPHMPPVAVPLNPEIAAKMQVRIPWVILGTQAALVFLLFVSSFLYSPHCYQYYFITKGNYILIPAIVTLFTIITIKRNRALIQCSRKLCCNRRPEEIIVCRKAYCCTGSPLFWTGLLLLLATLVSLDAAIGVGCEARGAERVSKDYPAEICRLLTVNNPHPTSRDSDRSYKTPNPTNPVGTVSPDTRQPRATVSEPVQAEHNATAHAIEQIDESTCYFQYIEQDYDFIRTRALLLNATVMVLGVALVSLVLFELVRILHYRRESS